MIPLSEDDIEQIQVLYAKSLTIEQIADSMDIPVTQVRGVIMMTGPPPTKKAGLEHQLQSMYQLIEIAKMTYTADPKMSNSTAVTQFITQQQSLIKQIQDLEDPKELYGKLLGAMQTMVRELLKPVVHGSNELTRDLIRAGVDTKIAEYHVEQYLRAVQITVGESYNRASRVIADLIEYEREQEEAGRVIPLPLPDRNANNG